MKHLPRLLCILSLAFILPSCSNKEINSNEGVKVILDISVRTYIESLTNTPIMLPDAYKNEAIVNYSDEQIIDDLIGTYLKTKSAKELLDIFSKNENLPIFETTNELKHFLISDYNAKVRRMHEVLINRIYAFTKIPKDKVIVKQTKNQIILFIPGVEDKGLILPVFKNRDGIRFWEALTINEIGRYVGRLNDTLSILAKQKNKHLIDTGKEVSLQDAVMQGTIEDKAKNVLYKLIQPSIDQNGKSYNVSFWAFAATKDTSKVNAIFSSAVYKAIFPDNIKMLWGNIPGKKDNSTTGLTLYAINTGINNTPLIDGNDIKNALFNYQNDLAEIKLEMNAKGAVKWANASARCVGKPIAMEVGNYVISAPLVREKITGGRSSISGDFTAKEGNDLANTINSGSFPLDFRIISIEKYKQQK